MRKLILIINIPLIFGSFTLQAQQVISSAGKYFKQKNAEISWTIGEPVIETLSNKSVILTQGYQQGYISSNYTKDLIIEGLRLDIFPNPTAETLNLHVKNRDLNKLKFFLHNLEGKIISHGSIESSLTKIDLYRYSNGVYLLRVVQESGEAVQSFRVVKQ